jgi:hypothetical protein
MKTLKELTNELGLLLEEKQEAYGDAIEESGRFLSLLYPNGITPENYNNIALLVRIFDKQKRIANGASNENSWQDIAGYGIQGLKITNKTIEAKEGLEKLKKYEDNLLKKNTKLCKYDEDQFCSVCYTGSQSILCDCCYGCDKCRGKKKKQQESIKERLKMISKIENEINKMCPCPWCTEVRRVNGPKQEKKCSCNSNEECYSCSQVFKKACNCFGIESCSECS